MANNPKKSPKAVSVAKGRSFTTVTYSQFMEQLEAAGYEEIGSGAFAKVFAKPGANEVVKVAHDYSNYNAEGKMTKSDPYLAFLRAIPKNNPLFPNVKRCERWVSRSVDSHGNEHVGSYYVVWMERLDVIHHHDMNPIYEELGISDYEAFDKWGLKNMKSAHAHVQGAVKVLRPLYNRFYSDIHSGNVMIRTVGKKKELVITDPVC